MTKTTITSRIACAFGFHAWVLQSSEQKLAILQTTFEPSLASVALGSPRSVNLGVHEEIWRHEKQKCSCCPATRTKVFNEGPPTRAQRREFKEA